MTCSRKRHRGEMRRAMYVAYCTHMFYIYFFLLNLAFQNQSREGGVWRRQTAHIFH